MVVVGHVFMDHAARRKRMVERHLRARGIGDPAVLAAMGKVPREALVPPQLADLAYEDSALPIGAGQTISQPYIVALMTEALRVRPGERVLEIGTGSGYAAAVLAELAGRVYTIERHAELASLAARRLAELGHDNIEVCCSDGTLGWPEHAPYQAIAVTAGGPELPAPLLLQLAIGGRLVMPLGGPRAQELVRVTRLSSDEYERENLGAVQFVPLIGEAGWPDAEGVDRARAGRPAGSPAAGGAQAPSEAAADARPVSERDVRDERTVDGESRGGRPARSWWRGTAARSPVTRR
jgi:protein-L-isoaspartate(D-aspartate) O-methyltransferase